MKKIKPLFLCILTLTFSLKCLCQDFPKPSNPQQLVNDYANFLSSDNKQLLEKELVLIDNNAKKQIAIITLDNIGDYEISDYAIKLGRNWGIGNKETNSGLLILIVKNTHKIWIATGYGMEGDLPDITCRKIINESIKPYFKQKKYFEGLQNAIIQIVENLAKNYDNKDEKITKFYEIFLQEINNNPDFKNLNKQAKPYKFSKFELIGIFIIIIIVIIIASIFGNGRGGGGFFIGNSFSGGFSSSGGSNSFGGFGGGSFGGGGAGGSW